MKPQRVVVDPNVLISLLIGKRISSLQVIFTDKRFRLVVDELLLDEFEEVGKRTKFRRFFGIEIVDVVLTALRKTAAVVPSPTSIPAVCRDADDDYILALCAEGKADVLLTGDKDLLVLERHGRTRIMNAREFVKKYLAK